jgi:hypothetical protein
MRCLFRLCIVLPLWVPIVNHAQNVASVASGFWDDPQTWDTGVVPSAPSSDQITIMAGHEVVIRDVREVDELIIADGGVLQIDFPGVCRLRDGAGIDIIIEGRVEVDGVIDGGDGSSIASNATTLFFNQTSSYIHRYTSTQGSIPLASWHPASVIEISGYTSAAAASTEGNWNQHFGSMVWNTPDLQNVFDLRGNLNHLRGDMMIQSTNSQQLLLSSLSGSDTLAVDGDLQLDGSASIELTNISTGDFTLRIGNDVIINTTGSLSIANHGKGIISIGNDFSLTNGTISESGTGTGEFIFNNATRHQFSRGASGLNGIFSGRINYSISAMDSLDLGIAVLSAGIGTNNANMLSVWGTIMVGSPDPAGAIQNNTTGGNVRTTVSQRVFWPGSRVIYSAQFPQFIGNAGVAAGANTETVIDNLSGVSLSSNVSIGGVLHLLTGSLQIGNDRILTLSNDVTRTNGQLSSTSTSTLAITDSIAGPRTLDLGNGQLVIGTLSIDRRAAGASVTFLSDILASQLNLLAGTLINDEHVTLAENGMLSRWPAGFLAAQEIAVTGNEQYDVTYRTSSISGGPFAKMYSGIELPSEVSRLRRLIIATGQSLDTVVLTKDITINNLLDMNRGRFYVQHHTINFKGSVWSDDTGNFGQGTGTVVFSDSTSVQGSSNPVFNSVRVLPGCYLRFTRNISVSGEIDFEPGSVVDATSITVTLTGSISQNINSNGTVVGGVTISKSNQSFVQLQSPLALRGILRFNTPSVNIDFRSNGFLTLLSAVDTATTSFGNSMIYRLQNGNSVSGDVTIQRFMSGEGRIYRYLSSPVNNATVAGWKDDFSITGNFSDPSPSETICGSMINRSSPSLYYYDEQKGATSSSGYVAYPLPATSSSASILQVGRGYSAFIRQCVDPTVVDLTGPVNQSQINLPVSYNSGSAMSGWNLVGNPYPCTIDWDVAGTQGWIKTNISPSIAIRDNGGGGFYRYWDGDGDPADLIEGRIAPGQGFWVRATAPNPVLAVREGVKVLQTADYYRERDSISVMIIELRHNNHVDKTYLKLREGASESLDSLDCPKLDNVTYDLATYSSDRIPLAINALNGLSCSGEMPLLIKDLEAGDYRFGSIAKGIFSNYLFTLRDNYTGEEKPLSDSYSFKLSTPVLFDDKRFTITWQHQPLKKVSLAATTYTLCESDSVVVGLSNPEDDVTYELWEDTVRVSGTLTVHANDLDVGEHRLRVRAIKLCQAEFVGDTIVVTRYQPVLLRWRDGDVCNEGTTILAATADRHSKVHWYASTHSDSIQAVDTVFITPVINLSTVFYAAAVNNGCTSRRVEVKANVVSYTSISISVEGNVLTSSMDDGNEWFMNGVPLANEYGHAIYASSKGIYSVRNKISSCVTEASVEFEGFETSIAQFYPNPVETTLTIASDFDDFVSVQLLNTLGQLVAEIETQAVGTEKIGIFDATKLKAGLYFLRLVIVGRKEEILMVVKK